MWRWFMAGALLNACYCDLIYTKKENLHFEVVGIFENIAGVQRRAFNDSINSAVQNEIQLRPATVQCAKCDSYSLWNDFCSAKDIAPIAVFGPQIPIADSAIRDQCRKAQIPHIQATWQPQKPGEPETNSTLIDDEEFKDITINFFPPADEISVAYAQLLKYYNWDAFGVLYEHDFGLMRVQKILAEYSAYSRITVRRLDPNENNSKIFKELKECQESRILLDCDADRIKKYINEANSIGMVDHYQHYILVSLDSYMHANELTRYPSNFTWLSIMEFDKLNDTQHHLTSRVGRWKTDRPQQIPPLISSFKTDALLSNDVANHILTALDKMNLTPSEMNRFRHKNHPCSDDVWPYGALFQRKLLETHTVGGSGDIWFDSNGKRVNYKLFVNEIYLSELNAIATWNSSQPNVISSVPRTSDLMNTQRSSKHFIIISRKAEPYFYKKKVIPDEDLDDKDEKDGKPENDEMFEGYSVDLVEEIFKFLTTKLKLNYTYEFSKQEHSKYGVYNPITKKWDGLIGDLLDKKADLAVCDLTVTEERKKVVDFSFPFMQLGISILYTQEHEIPPDALSFLNPYSFEVWMYTATAYCVVSIVLFVCSRISPADWENPQPCDKEPEELENIWNFKNCAWLTMGSIMTQGCDILPKAIGSRWVCGMWWFFAMIVCQTYIAQLAASLTSAAENEPINDVEDLAKQNKILYGAIRGGSTLEFFKNSKNKMYQKMYENMITNDVVLVRDNDEGERRVLNSKNKYAFFMESTAIEFKMKRSCELSKVGNELDSKYYAIAMPANSPFRSVINQAILDLEGKSILKDIKDKWWSNEEHGAKPCEEKEDVNDVEGDLEMENLIGAFLMLVVGLFLCLFITAAEFFNEVRNIVVRENVTHKEAFIKELRASLNFFRLEKPVLRNLSRLPSEAVEQPTKAVAITTFLDLEKIAQ